MVRPRIGVNRVSEPPETDDEYDPWLDEEEEEKPEDLGILHARDTREYWEQQIEKWLIEEKGIKSIVEMFCDDTTIEYELSSYTCPDGCEARSVRLQVMFTDCSIDGAQFYCTACNKFWPCDLPLFQDEETSEVVAVLGEKTQEELPDHCQVTMPKVIRQTQELYLERFLRLDSKYSDIVKDTVGDYVTRWKLSPAAEMHCGETDCTDTYFARLEVTFGLEKPIRGTFTCVACDAMWDFKDVHPPIETICCPPSVFV